MGSSVHDFPGLRDIHKECLRLAGNHYSSKEIARMLGISKHTVDQRLRHATQQMQAASRFEAARRFCALEAAQSQDAAPNSVYDPIVYNPPHIPLPTPVAKEAASNSEQGPLNDTEGSRLQDAQAPFYFGDASRIEALFSTSVSKREVPPSPLSLGSKSLLVAAIAAISLLAFAAAVAALEVLSRI
jgi:Bacterial regulatory proteins, luxR family